VALSLVVMISILIMTSLRVAILKIECKKNFKIMNLGEI